MHGRAYLREMKKRDEERGDEEERARIEVGKERWREGGRERGTEGGTERGREGGREERYENVPFVDWLIAWLVGGLNVSPVCWLVSWLASSKADRLPDRMIGR